MARTGDWASALRLLHELHAAGASGDKFMYHAILSSILKAAPTARARTLATRATRDARKLVAKALQVAWQMLSEESPVEVDERIYATIISIFSKLSPSPWPSALRLLDAMRSSGVYLPPPNAYTSTITACAASEPPAWVTAMRIATRMSETSPLNTFTCNALLNALARGRQWRRAEGLFQDMLRGDPLETPAGPLGSPNGVTYTSLINAYSAGGYPNLALATLSDMRREGFEITPIALSAAIRSCTAHGGRMWQSALALYHAEENRRTPDGGDVYRNLGGRGSDPRLAMLSVLAVAGQWELAEGLLRDCRRTLPYKGYVAVLESYIRPGLWASALALAREMENGPRQFKLSAHVFRVLARTCRRRRRWDLALGLLGEMREKKVPISAGVVAEVISTFKGRGDAWRVALWVSRGILGGPEGEDYLDLWRLGREGRRLLKVERLAMVRIMDSLIDLCETGHRWDVALEIHEKLRAAGVPSSLHTYDSLMAICAQAGQPRPATRILSRVRDELGKEPPSQFQNGVIAAYAHSGDWEMALETLGSLASRGLEANIDGFNSVMRALSNSYQWREAISLLEEMDTVGLSADYETYDALISVCELCGRWERALAYYERMERHLDYREFERRSRSKSLAVKELEELTDIYNATTLHSLVSGQIPGTEWSADRMPNYGTLWDEDPTLRAFWRDM